MKRNMKNTILIAIALAAAFGLGLWVMYIGLMTDMIFNHLLPALDKIFVS